MGFHASLLCPVRASMEAVHRRPIIPKAVCGQSKASTATSRQEAHRCSCTHRRIHISKAMILHKGSRSCRQWLTLTFWLNLFNLFFVFLCSTLTNLGGDLTVKFDEAPAKHLPMPDRTVLGSTEA